MPCSLRPPIAIRQLLTKPPDRFGFRAGQSRLLVLGKNRQQEDRHPIIISEEMNDPETAAFSTPLSRKSHFSYAAADQNAGPGIARNRIDGRMALVIAHNLAGATLKF